MADSAELKFKRFEQRRSNLRNANVFLQQTLAVREPDAIVNAAIIKAFEMAFEFCWKSLKDLLEYNGLHGSGPREIIKLAFRESLVTDGQSWIELLDRRNQLTHVYDQAQALLAAKEIGRTAAPLIEALVKTLDQRGPS